MSEKNKNRAAGLNDIQAGHIEDTGLFFEKLGLTRMAGRIFGYLMVADKENVAFEELPTVLNASKSSISTNVRVLVQIGFIKPVTFSGDRKTYFCLMPEMDWGTHLNRKVQDLDHMKKIFEKSYEFRKNKNDNTSLWLKESIDFYIWLMEIFPELIEKWRESRKK